MLLTFSVWTVKYDEAFESVFRLVLHFPFDPQDSLVSPSYNNALEQLHLPITEGGFLVWASIQLLWGLLAGMQSENLVLGPAVGLHWERVVSPTFWPALTNAVPLWTSVASEPAEAGIDFVILDCDGLFTYLDDAPSQHDVYQALTGVLCQLLEMKLAATADGIVRL